MMIIDHDEKIGIGVIVAFSPKGKMQPIYFQVIEDGEKIPVKVKQVLWAVDEPTRVVYKCLYEQNGIEREVELHYIRREHLWMIGK